QLVAVEAVSVVDRVLRGAGYAVLRPRLLAAMNRGEARHAPANTSECAVVPMAVCKRELRHQTIDAWWSEDRDRVLRLASRRNAEAAGRTARARCPAGNGQQQDNQSQAVR